VNKETPKLSTDSLLETSKNSLAIQSSRIITKRPPHR
jgi:hypothetical protein